MFKAEYFFVRILLPFVLGIGIFYFFPGEKTFLTLSCLSIILLIIILLINIAYKKLNAYKFKGLTGILILSFFFTLGGSLCILENEKLNSDYFAKQHYTYLKVWVNDEPQQVNDIVRFKTRIIAGYENHHKSQLSGQLLLALKVDSIHPIHLKYGDELIIAAKYSEVEPPYNPAEFNFKRWLASQNIYQQAFINQIHLLKTNQNRGNKIIRLALQLREHQVAKYRKLIKNDEAFAVASTLILGYRADLSKETLAAYSKTGTIHALSVSGSHVAIIFLLLNFLLSYLDRNRLLRIIKFIVICSLIWVYALVTGLSPSVLRSAIMISIFIFAKTFARNKNGYNTLAFAAFCQLIYNPFLLWDVGFQLSYISVFGLIYLQPKIYKWVYVKNKWLNNVWELIALSLAAQIVTFPLCLYYFHQFPVYFLLGNLFIAIPLFIIMILGIAVLFPVADQLASVFEWIINQTNAGLKLIAELPYATFSSEWIRLTELILLSLALALLIFSLVNHIKKLLYLSLILYIVYSCMILKDDWNAKIQSKIIFFSLRKNYAAAFIDGRQSILLTDLNVNDKNFMFFVKPALEEAHINVIHFIDFKKDTTINNFVLKNNQIVFKKFSILVVDEKMNHKKITTSKQFSSLWLTGNTYFKLDQLLHLKYQTLVIDATNRDWRIKSFKTLAENNKITPHILKKNPAYLVNLTQ